MKDLCPQCGCVMKGSDCPQCQPKLVDVPVKQTWRDEQ